MNKNRFNPTCATVRKHLKHWFTADIIAVERNLRDHRDETSLGSQLLVGPMQYMVTSKSYKLPPAIEWLVVAVIIGGLFAVVYPAVQNLRDLKGPHGETIPSQPPSEVNRLAHPTGISIVAPINWDQIRDQGPDVPFLCIAARGGSGRRLKSWITIQVCSEPDAPQIAKFRKVTFQGHPAYEAMTINREDTFDDRGLSTWQLYWRRQDKWWNVTFCIADEMTVLPDQIRAYVNTIKVP